jgi:hypothetical protein
VSRETRTWVGALALIVFGPVAFIAMLALTTASGWGLFPAIVIEVMAMLAAFDLLRPRQMSEPAYVGEVLGMLHSGLVTFEQADTLLMRATIISGDSP